GAAGQLGRALVEAFPDALALARSDWDVTRPPPSNLATSCCKVLHAAAWTDVDRAEGDPESARAVNVGGTARVVSLGVPGVYFSTDCVFDGGKGTPYLAADATG